MHFTSKDQIYHIVRSFEERTLSEAEWTHAARLTVALCYLKCLPFALAKNVMRDGIRWFNDKHGVPNNGSSGYHETLTVFWLKRVWNFLDSRSDSRDLVALANELISRYKDPDHPLRFYSRGLLFSAEARRDYYPPDLPAKPAFTYAVTMAILKPLA